MSKKKIIMFSLSVGLLCGVRCLIFFARHDWFNESITENSVEVQDFSHLMPTITYSKSDNYEYVEKQFENILFQISSYGTTYNVALDLSLGLEKHSEILSTEIVEKAEMLRKKIKSFLRNAGKNDFDYHERELARDLCNYLNQSLEHGSIQSIYFTRKFFKHS